MISLAVKLKDESNSKQYEEKYGPGDYIPPVHTMFWSFRAMVMSGTFMLLLELTDGSYQEKIV